jgi:hypothetical protein
MVPRPDLLQNAANPADPAEMQGTSAHEERPVPADVLTPLPLAAALSHLRGASVAVERLLVDVDPSDPLRHKLLEAALAIHTAHKTLTDCVQPSR